MTAVNPKQKRKVFLVDDHPLVREWLTNLINQQPDLAVCGESESAPEAFQAIAASKPDVAILDLSLKDSSGKPPARIRSRRIQPNPRRRLSRRLPPPSPTWRSLT